MVSKREDRRRGGEKTSKRMETHENDRKVTRVKEDRERALWVKERPCYEAVKKSRRAGRRRRNDSWLSTVW